jgi:methionine-rich copper-binding protein CopC
MCKILPVFAAALALLIALPAQAHSRLTASEPAAEATVEAPKSLNLTFSADLRLVMLKLTADGIDDIVLPVDRTAPAAKTFSLPLPALKPATYTVRWTGSGEDGHIMKGKFVFTVAPSAGPAAKP